MSRFPGRHRTREVGIALGLDEVVAAMPGTAGRAWTHPLTPWGNAGVGPADLSDALRALRAAITTHDGPDTDEGGLGERFDGRLHVALVPPLGHVRLVEELRGLRTEEALQVVRREPTRYLPLPLNSPPLEVALEGTHWRRTTTFSIFAAPRTLVDAIHAAVDESGWRLAEIVSAQSAWAAGAESRLAREDHAIAICLGDRVELVRMAQGRMIALRRIPAASRDCLAQCMAALDAYREDRVDAPPPVVVFGESAVARDLRAALGRRDPGVAIPGSEDSPSSLAAQFAPVARGPALLPESVRTARRQAIRRRSLGRFAGAAALLVLSAVMQAWGAARERAVLNGERQRLRGAVTRALAARDSLAETTTRLSTLRTAAETAPRWSALISSLAAELPEDAFLLSLRTDADTLRLEGSAPRASLVFDALGHVAGVRSVRPSGPIQQEVKSGGVTTEHFAVAAALWRRP